MWQQNPMMFNNGYVPNYNTYNQPNLPQSTQAIQQVNQPVQKQASCFFVKTPEELASINVMPNVFYMGINRDDKEIYMRRMNNDGNIEVEKYVRASETKEKSEMQKVLERLENIEKKLTITTGAQNVAVSNVDHE